MLPLLAFLALNRGASVRRETIAFALWPDEREADARANLRRHLHRLSQALPPNPTPWVESNGATIGLSHGASAWFDIDAFERAISEERLEDAVGLYGGDLLEGCDEPWIDTERERLRGAFLAALVALARRARAAGAYHDLVPLAQRILAVEPWREDALRWLVAARFGLGDRGAALAEYETFARRLREEFDAAPADETRALKALIVEDIPLRTTIAPDGHEREPRRQLPFVGREKILAQAMRQWERATNGDGATILIGGEAGVGKSRLTGEIVTRVESHGGRILAGGTGAFETQPYQAVVEALRRALPSLLAHDVTALWMSVLSDVLPEIAIRAPEVAKPRPLEPMRERRRLFDSIARAFETLARARPTFLILEDLHWARPDMLELFEELARFAAALPLFIVATYRDDSLRDDARRTFRRLENDEAALALPLGPLSLSDVRLLTSRIFDGDPNLEKRATTLYALSAGNALFLDEAIRANDETAGDATPPTLRETIAQRIGRLPDEARALGGNASVLEGGFDVDVLREICAWHESEVLDALDALLDNAIVRAGTNRTRAGFVFTHQLLRAALYEQTPEPARRLAHRRAARALARLYPERRADLAAELAMHYERAGLPAEASCEYIVAARRAAALFASDDVVRLATRGLAIATEIRERYELFALREANASRRGERDAATADLAEMERCANELDDDGARCDVLVRQVSAYHVTGDMTAAAAAIVRLECLAKRTANAARIAVAKSCAATHVQLQGRTREAIEALHEALAAYRSIGDIREVALILGQMAEMQALTADLTGALQNMDAAVTSARGLGDRALLAAVLGYACRTAQHLRRYDVLKRTALELLSAARELGDVTAEAQALTSYGSACVALFDIESAEEHYAAAAELHRRCGNRLGAAVIASNRAVLFGRVGDWERAREFAEIARADFSELGDVARELAATFNLGQAYLETGDPGRALELATRARALALEHGGAPLEAAAIGMIGVCERHLGRYEEAVEHLEECIERERLLPNAAEMQSSLAELTLTHAERGDAGAALLTALELRFADDVASDLTNPQILPWAAHRAYRLVGADREAAQALRQAHAIVAKRLQTIPTERWRGAYRNWWLNRLILTAMETSRSHDYEE